MSNGDMATTQGSRPVPDPTELTTRAVNALDAAVKDRETAFKEWVQGQLTVRDQRMDSMDEATTLRLQVIDGIPTLIKTEVAHLSDISDVRFDGIQVQFKERDTRSEAVEKLNKVALDAAFAASKEAVAAALTAQKEAAAKQDEANAKAIDKSEKATAETIKTNAELGNTRLDALAISLNDIKDRVVRIESTKAGAAENRSGTNANVALVVSGILVLIAIVTFLLVTLPKIGA